MAEQAVQVVLGLRHERAPAFSRVEMATTLVVRDSTDVPPDVAHESFVRQLET
jgi:DNA-binding LacI/PurR family transcriptional regulator